jgi:UDP-N-acetylmuramoyl-tripeptide--D-alanyl-D-alanine ligase
MELRSLKYIADACGGRLAQGSPETQVARVCTDSRQARCGDLFVALAGDRFDGHDFLGEASQKGVAAVMVQSTKARPLLPVCAVVEVDHTRRALGQLATRYRQDFALPIVAVGGSNGKTTTKELLAAVLRQKLATLWNEASYNNDVGVPLTLLNLENSHQVAVLEVGTNHPGELAPLVGMVQPRYGVITGLGREHMEFFGDMPGVAQEEGWLAELLPAEGKLFVNRDVFEMKLTVARARATVVRIGRMRGDHWRASKAKVDATGTTFWVKAPIPDYTGEYNTQLLGQHQAINALFAVAIGAEFGLSRAEIQRGLADCQPPKMRLQLWNANGVQVLDDAYNANADSMRAALETLHELPCQGRRIAVLGDMAELGQTSHAAHAEIGRRAAGLGIGTLFAVGQMAGVVAAAAREAGLWDVHECDSVEAAATAVKRFVKADDLVLIKASRATRIERVGEALRTEE